MESGGCLNDSAKDQRERPAGDGKTGRPGPAVGGEVSGPLSLWLFCLCLAAVQEAPVELGAGRMMSAVPGIGWEAPGLTRHDLMSE